MQLIGPHFLAFPFSPTRQIKINVCRSQENFESHGRSWVALDDRNETCQTKNAKNNKEKKKIIIKKMVITEVPENLDKKKKKQFRNIKEETKIKSSIVFS